MYIISSPLKGKVVKQKDLNDPAFSSGALGPCIGIAPKEGKLYSPADGTVISVFPTGHAITMESPDKLQLILHVGIDTVGLQGKGFTPKVKDEQPVKKGDLLLEFDMEVIEKAGFLTETPIVIVNPEEFGEINFTEAEEVDLGDMLAEVSPKQTKQNRI